MSDADDWMRLLRAGPSLERSSTQSIMGAIERDVGGIAVIWCADLGSRDWLVDDIEAMVPSKVRAMRASTVEQALAEPDRLVFLVPQDEATTISEMEGRRDQIVVGPPARTQPIVLFLIRSSAGARALAKHAPSLSGVIRGNEVDPERLEQIDVGAERSRFVEETGEPPERWLERWKAGELPMTSNNLAKSFHARLLEGE
jgi:hypothetical protein